MIPDHLQKDFVTLEDGFVYYWPEGSNGCFASHQLREIADELDSRNKDWAVHLSEALSELTSAERE